MSETKWVKVTDESQLADGAKVRLKFQGEDRSGTIAPAEDGAWNLSGGGRYLYVFDDHQILSGITDIYIATPLPTKPQQPPRTVTVNIGDNAYTSDGVILIGDIDVEYTEETLAAEINKMRRALSQYRREVAKGVLA